MRELVLFVCIKNRVSLFCSELKKAKVFSKHFNASIFFLSFFSLDLDKLEEALQVFGLLLEIFVLR